MKIERRSEGADGFEQAFLSLSSPSKRAYDELLLRFASHLHPRSDFFLLKKGERTLARLGASIRPDGVAHLGFLAGQEAEGAALITEASAWARGQKAKTLLAPVDLSTWFDYRLRMPDTLGSEPDFAWEPGIEPEAGRTWRSAGFRPVEGYVSRGWRSEDPAQLLGIGRAGERCMRRLERAGFRFEIHESAGFSPALLLRIHRLTHAAFAGVPHFEAVPEAIFEQIYVRGAASRAENRILICQNPAAEDCGFLYSFEERDALILKTVAVPPAYRMKGVSAALIHLGAREAFARGIRHAVSALVREGSRSPDLERPSLAGQALAWQHEYALLGRDL